MEKSRPGAFTSTWVTRFWFLRKAGRDHVFLKKFAIVVRVNSPVALCEGTPYGGRK